ncbi:pyridoxal phosphate-dependent aminotransferase [Acaryochloris sp. IP29b_bin.137]|uniref:pyridoxal phosphate-dependent aminotransferase n=1 Tax=Acaryochloris sp. IP29b_bin.137 TaxID=2969217 RepID=UPI00262BD176|nr:pyridoxal phosphate-dependent aminotransferase [Acaryochloris sp. IP29b_bin.137]
MSRPSARVEAVQAPIIPIIGDLIRQYPGTLSLGQGVVSYGPPPEALAQLATFHQHPGVHLYQSVQGIPPLIDAIAQKLQAENQLPFASRDQIMVTAGGNMAFINAVLAILDPGDEVILQTPYYFNHEMAIRLANGRPVCVPTDQRYQLQLDQIEAAITERTRAIVTVSPNNPSGAVYSAADLQAVNQLCCDRNLYHISDEAYEYFTYDGVDHISPGRFDPDQTHTISLFTLSKAYGFASWRIGYMVIPTHLLEAIQKIQDTVLICPPVVSQYAAVGALQVGRDYCHQHLGSLAEKRALVQKALLPVKRLVVPESSGAFYVLIQVDTDLSDRDVVEQLIRKYGVAVIPGSAFGMELGCYLRIAYGALDAATLAAGLDRLVRGLSEILGAPTE